MKFTGFICGPTIYEFQGWTFEFSRISGPWPLKKNGDPRDRVGKKFWKMYNEFTKLTEKEQDTCRVGGGCQRI